MTFFYISLDKVKPIELNAEASVDTQNVSNTRLAHFEAKILRASVGPRSTSGTGINYSYHQVCKAPGLPTLSIHDIQNDEPKSLTEIAQH
ncbi:unnamed protein product [Rotaria sp. Silwood1]|nr:unnamed protein product [Rotaria sp. Silwood1]